LLGGTETKEVEGLPTYAYRCGTCSHQFERFQKMSDEPVMECELCGSDVQRVLFPVAVHFKGTGFYTTDYARKKSMAACGKSGSCSEESCPAAAGESSPKAEATVPCAS
jgi:putative FmdB family regulatory protein